MTAENVVNLLNLARKNHNELGSEIDDAIRAVQLWEYRYTTLTIPKDKIHVLTPNEKFLWDAHAAAIKTIGEQQQEIQDWKDRFPRESP